MVKLQTIRQENEFTEVLFKIKEELVAAFFEDEKLLDTQFSQISRSLTLLEQDELFKKIRLHRLTCEKNNGIDIFYNQMKKIKLLKHQVPLFLEKMKHETYGYSYTISIKQTDVGKKYQHLGGPDSFFGVHENELSLPGIKTIIYRHLKQMVVESGENFEELLADRGYNVFSVKIKENKFPFI